MPPSRDAALNRIRLRHLQCFLAVAEARNLRRAAEALAISQPAVTKTLNELEEILGVRLFERGRGGARPTPEAELFLRHASASVQSLAQAVDAMLRGRDEALPLRVGALPTVAPSVLPRVLRAYRTARPGAELRVITGRNADRKSTRLNSSHGSISYAVFCLKKKRDTHRHFERVLAEQTKRDVS